MEKVGGIRRRAGGDARQMPHPCSGIDRPHTGLPTLRADGSAGDHRGPDTFHTSDRNGYGGAREIARMRRFYPMQ